MPRDCIATDIVERVGFTENYQVYHHADMQFCYLSEQLSSEIILFRQTDTEEGCESGTWVFFFPNPMSKIVVVRGVKLSRNLNGLKR